MAAKRQVGMAVIGLGAIGPTHALWCASLPESKLVAVCDMDARRAQSIARELETDFHTDYREVLERKDVDAVVIAAPTHLHVPMGIAAAQAGKHVAVEKPLGTTLEEADELIAAVRGAGVHSQYLENLCFSPAYRQAKDIIDAGGLGELFFVRCCESAGGGLEAQLDVYRGIDTGKSTGGEGETFGSWYVDPKKSGGGMLMSAGCHSIMYARFLTNRAPVTRVYAELINLIGRDPAVEDAGYVTIRYASGQVAWIDSSSINALGTFDDRAEIYGTKGSIFLDLYRSTPIRVYSQSGYGRIGASMFGGIPDADRNWSYPIADERWSLGYPAELRHFLHCILDDREPEITLIDGRATLEVVVAAYQSGRSGNSVSPQPTLPSR